MKGQTIPLSYVGSKKTDSELREMLHTRVFRATESVVIQTLKRSQSCWVFLSPIFKLPQYMMYLGVGNWNFHFQQISFWNQPSWRWLPSTFINTHEDKQPFTLSLAPNNYKLLMNLARMFLVGGLKPVSPEKTHMRTERTCKLHSERPQAGRWTCDRHAER